MHRCTLLIVDGWTPLYRCPGRTGALKGGRRSIKITRSNEKNRALNSRERKKGTLNGRSIRIIPSRTLECLLSELACRILGSIGGAVFEDEFQSIRLGYPTCCWQHGTAAWLTKSRITLAGKTKHVVSIYKIFVRGVVHICMFET